MLKGTLSKHSALICPKIGINFIFPKQKSTNITPYGLQQKLPQIQILCTYKKQWASCNRTSKKHTRFGTNLKCARSLNIYIVQRVSAYKW